MSGAVRCVAAAKDLNQAPRSARNLTGEVEELFAAAALSLPRGERPTPQTKFWLLTPCRASYEAASARPQISADWFWPDWSYCGFTKRSWLHSFITMNSCTDGNVFATSAVHDAKAWICCVLPQPCGSVDGAH